MTGPHAEGKCGHRDRHTAKEGDMERHRERPGDDDGRDRVTRLRAEEERQSLPANHREPGRAVDGSPAAFRGRGALPTP